MAHRLCQLRVATSLPSPPDAKSCFATLGPSLPRAKLSRIASDRGLLLRPTVPSIRQYRFGPPKTSKPSVPAKAQTGTSKANSSVPPKPNNSPAVETGTSRLAPHHGSEARQLCGAQEEAALLALEDTKNQLLCGHSIPEEQEVLSALEACTSFASLHAGKWFRHGSKTQATELDSSASSLLSLDGTSSKRTKTAAVNVNDHISRLAFDIVCHPSVVFTPPILDAYVGIQSLLGNPDTLPHVLELYASKPKPQGRAGTLEFAQQNPDSAAHAIDPIIAEKALTVAIEAKSLDAAVGVVANTYGTKAFIRQKMLRKALLPAAAAASMPLAVYVVASRLAKFQQLYDDRTATAMAAMGLLVYAGSTVFMGFLALFTHNDQMNRVTWAPGMRLFSRWLHEEERAGLDRVACAFGFSELNRRGEEEGHDFEALRKYILLKGMVLDRVESMPGMK